MKKEGITVNYFGVFTALLGVFLFATKAIIIKLAYQNGMDAQTMILLRMGIALPVYLGVLFWPKHFQVIKLLDIKSHIQIVLLGIIGYYLSSLLDFWGLQYISANLERLILFVYPTMVVLLSYAFLKKKILRYQWIAIVLTYVGLAITLGDNMSFTQGVVWKGCLFVFLSAFTYASYLVWSGEYLNKLGVLPFTAYAMVISTVCVMIHSVFTYTVPFEKIPEIVYWQAIVLSIFATIIPSFLISYAIKQIGASNVSIIGSVGPLFTIFLSILLLGESMSVLQVLGGVIVLAGVFWVTKYK